jgi:hypothetical protein
MQALTSVFSTSICEAISKIKPKFASKELLLSHTHLTKIYACIHACMNYLYIYMWMLCIHLLIHLCKDSKIMVCGCDAHPSMHAYGCYAFRDECIVCMDMCVDMSVCYAIMNASIPDSSMHPCVWMLWIHLYMHVWKLWIHQICEHVVGMSMNA